MGERSTVWVYPKPALQLAVFSLALISLLQEAFARAQVRRLATTLTEFKRPLGRSAGCRSGGTEASEVTITDLEAAHGNRALV